MTTAESTILKDIITLATDVLRHPDLPNEVKQAYYQEIEGLVSKLN